MGEKRSQEQPTRIERFAKKKVPKVLQFQHTLISCLSALSYSFLACMPLYMIQYYVRQDTMA